MPRLCLCLVVLLPACGAGPAVDGPFLEMLEQAPRISAGRVSQIVQVAVPSSVDASGCALVWRWRGQGAGGELGPLPPTRQTRTDAVWEIDTVIGEADLVRAEGEVTCGTITRALHPRHAALPSALPRYCALCPERAPTPIRVAEVRSRDGIEVWARVGVAIEVSATGIVDRCTGRTLVDLTDLEGARLHGGTDEESIAHLLFDADHGVAVCETPMLPNAVTIEIPSGVTPESVSRFQSIPDLVVGVGLPPYPG